MPGGIAIERLLIYGASGYPGKLFAREAVARSLRPVLAGRNDARLRPLAENLGLSWRVAQLFDPPSLNRLLQDVSLVVNCASPYSVSATPLVGACLRVGTHYLDVNADVAALEALRQLDAARRLGRNLLHLPYTAGC